MADLAWTACALKSARSAGLLAGDAFMDEVRAALDRLTDPSTLLAAPRAGAPVDLRATAMGMFARILAGADARRDAAVTAGVRALLGALPVWDESAPGAIDMLRWYFGTVALFQVGGEAWKTWNEALKPGIVDSVVRDGEHAGSVDPLGPWVAEAGRTASTSLLTMCMEVYYRYARVFGSKGGAVPAPAVLPPSTGGTREPNGNPYGDVFFQHYGVNPFEDTEDDAQSTFALDVDTASFSIARRFIADGALPDPAAVRTEEFVNRFPTDDPPPAEGVFALRAEGMASRFGGPRYHLLRLGIRAKDVAATDRPPARLTFVVDASGSMAAENRLGLVKRALGFLVSQLRPDDEVALVVYRSSARLLLPHGKDRAALRRAIGKLETGGSTNASEGLEIAYEQAAKAFLPGGINRIVLCSDGVANTGETEAGKILGLVAAERKKGIEISTVGFGMGNYNDILMETLANKGNGNYFYVDTIHEARRVFLRELTGMLTTVAKDAKVQVEWNPSVVARYRLLGYENRDVRDEDFRKDDVDGGEIGAGHAVSALYELKLHANGPPGPLGTFRIRYADPATPGRVVEESVPIEREVLSGEPSRTLLLCAAAAEFAEILRKSYWARDGSLRSVADLVSGILDRWGRREEVVELLDLVNRAAALMEGTAGTPPEERPVLEGR
jgi:Ca-activated chloride channel family protein